MNKMKKIKIVGIVVLVVCVASFLVYTFFLSKPKSLIKRRNGTDYTITTTTELAQLADYSYSADNESSIWDFYSVEYKVTSFQILYEYTRGSYYNYPSYETNHKLKDVEESDASGYMAHSKGLFYIREEAYGFMVVEVLIDKVNNCMAFSCTVPKYLKKILEEVVEEETFTSGWICFNNLDQKLVEEVLIVLDRFYDYGVIACLDKEGYYTKEGDVYTLKQTATTLKDEDLIKTFKIPGLPDFYTVELTQASAEVNLKKGKTPKVKYSLTGYFKDVNKSITCEGTLKYNYINNVVVDVPQDVRDTWEKYEGYKRDFD